jgi:hypothetical protein
MKKKLLLVSLSLLISYFTPAQDFTGQWKGTFLDKSSSFSGWGGDRCDYVLELEVNGKKVTGYSYTYFTDGGKRYYTICSLSGFINKPEKYIEIREIVRTKTNVPNTIRNCFQVHKLTYYKQEDSEVLEGSWIPAPDQVGDCGFGTTSLQRRVLKKNYSLYNPVARKAPVNAAKKKIPYLGDKKKSTNPVAINKNKSREKEQVLKPKNEFIQEPVDTTDPKKIIQDKIIAPIPIFEKRNNTIIKTIEVENVSVKVDLYDNGEIDGDSISLFYNGKLLLSHKRLSAKPITLYINVDNDKSVNELDMYAENLGSIPPNTALMVVTDGSHRYEVRITSDLKKSGAIRFIHKQDAIGN